MQEGQNQAAARLGNPADHGRRLLFFSWKNKNAQICKYEMNSRWWDRGDGGDGGDYYCGGEDFYQGRESRLQRRAPPQLDRSGERRALIHGGQDCVEQSFGGGNGEAATLLIRPAGIFAASLTNFSAAKALWRCGEPNHGGEPNACLRSRGTPHFRRGELRLWTKQPLPPRVALRQHSSAMMACRVNALSIWERPPAVLQKSTVRARRRLAVMNHKWRARHRLAVRIQDQK